MDFKPQAKSVTRGMEFTEKLFGIDAGRAEEGLGFYSMAKGP